MLLVVAFDSGPVYLLYIANNSLNLVSKIEESFKSIHTVKYSNHTEEFLIGSKQGELVVFNYFNKRLNHTVLNAKEKRSFLIKYKLNI